MEVIARHFEESLTFTDHTPLGKMRDTYPLDRFTLQRAHVFFVEGDNTDAFLYVLIMALWTEVIEDLHMPW
jgi:hypothetical protein